MNPSLLWNTLVAQLKASPSKAATLGVLLLVLVVVVAGQLVGGPRSAEAAVATLSSIPIVAVEHDPESQRAARPPRPLLSDTPTRDLFSTDWAEFAPVSVGKDPVAPSDKVTQEKPTPRWVLELTLTDPASLGQHFAVINGIRVKAGDKILGLSVDTITPGTVVLVGGKNERIVLHMN